MDDSEEFARVRAAAVREQGADESLRAATRDWMLKTFPHGYTYNFKWLGRPVIQFPQDLMALQEIIWETKPDVIVETGIARGGSTVFLASMLALLGGDGYVVAVDIDIRAHNRAAIEGHPLASRIKLIQGSSVDPHVVDDVKKAVGSRRSVMVVLDSNHTHEHVLGELRAYAPLVKAGNYVVVFDTSIEDVPSDLFANRPWGPGNSPKSAVNQYIEESGRFELDSALEQKILITVAPGGFLRCVRD